jgi:dephospho-CoA kinase
VARLLVVDCSTATQIQRVRARGAWSAEAVSAVIRTQATRGERLDAADDVIVNEGGTDQLDARVARLHAHYLEFAGAQPCAPSGTIASP